MHSIVESLPLSRLHNTHTCTSILQISFVTHISYTHNGQKINLVLTPLGCSFAILCDIPEEDGLDFAYHVWAG